MDDPRWLRIIVVGLVLAIMAVVYFLLSGGLGIGKPRVQNQSNQPNKVVVVTPTPSPMPIATIQPQRTATPSAYSQIVNRVQGSAQTLPNTGFPVGLAVIITATAVGSGLAFRKFPK